MRTTIFDFLAPFLGSAARSNEERSLEAGNDDADDVDDIDEQDYEGDEEHE